jgi:hypothetical protein
LGHGELGNCANDLDPDLTDTMLDDASVPPNGDGYFYLITADDTVGTGGSEGSRGLGTCVERTVSLVMTCP